MLYNLTKKSDTYPLLKSDNDIILSYPRSGNTFIRYFLEEIYDRPTWGIAGIPENTAELKFLNNQWSFKGIVLDRPLKGINVVKKGEHTFEVSRNLPLEYYKRKPFFKAHNLDKRFNKDDRLLLIVRDPYECLLREFSVNELEAKIFFDRELKYYFDNLLKFEEWSGPKNIVYYEDMIKNPIDFFDEVFNFYFTELSFTKIIYQKKIDSFLRNLDYHRLKCIQIYKGHGASSMSGESINYHKENNDIKNRYLFNQIKSRIDNNLEYKKLFDLYLKRYKNTKVVIASNITEEIPSICKIPNIKEFLKNAEYFVETGTYHGDTLKYITNNHPDIYCYSCEINSKNYMISSCAFENANNVTIKNLDSRIFLKELTKDKPEIINKKIIFWLDAHGDDRNSGPVVDEIKFITENFSNYFILVDDVNIKENKAEDQFDLSYILQNYNESLNYYIPNFLSNIAVPGWLLITNQYINNSSQYKKIILKPVGNNDK